MEKHAYDFDLKLEDAVSTHAIQFRIIPTGSRVLDIGCHTGILGEALRQKKQCIVTGIDSDTAALEVARLRLNAVTMANLEVPGWSTSLVASDARFDVVLFGDVLEHTKEPERILEEGRALLSAKGFAIVSLPNIANLRIRLGLLGGKFEYGDSGILDQTHIRFFTLSTARRMVREAGYAIVSETYSGYSMPRWLIDLFPSLFAVNVILCAVPTANQ